MSEFQSFHDIIRLYSPCTITEKIHGTNAQVLVEERLVFQDGTSCIPGANITGRCGKLTTLVKAGSRTRWVTPEDDNFGFARWVKDNEADIIRLLGLGRHYGEWYGSGINHGYGLPKGEKRFALFNLKFFGQELPQNCHTVPVVYRGAWYPEVIEQAMKGLKELGSKAVPGFMQPEGCVLRFERNGSLFKHVFEAEESAWQGKPKEKARETLVYQDRVNALLQPIRLEKLLSRDERYTVGYPETLPEIAKAYLEDLEKEQQLEGVDKDVAKALKKQLFGWIKEAMKMNGLAT